MVKVTFKTDLKINEITRMPKGSRANMTPSKWELFPVGAYIETNKKTHKSTYSSLFQYGQKNNRKFSSVTDINGISRIFRIA